MYKKCERVREREKKEKKQQSDNLSISIIDSFLNLLVFLDYI